MRRGIWILPLVLLLFFAAGRVAEKGDLVREHRVDQNIRYLPSPEVLRIGDQATFDAPASALVDARQPVLTQQDLEVHDYGPPVPWDELLEDVSVRSKALHGQFLHMGKLAVPDLIVRVSDHDRNLRLSLGKEAREAGAGDSAHIEAHSQAMRSCT